MLTKELTLLSNWIKEAKSIVFFGGAGVSTSSGIPDFRGKSGLTDFQKTPVETLLSHQYFMSHPHEFYDFYSHYMIHRDALPNIVHRYLATLEKTNPSLWVITQNIDGLHQKAGSMHVLELHGTIEMNTCVKCHQPYHLDQLDLSKGVPYCSCEGIIKPNVVLYGEMLDQKVLSLAINAVKNADLFLVCGTSLVVYPAAGLIHEYHGNRLVIINQTPTSFDQLADLVINAPLEEVFSHLD